MLAVAAKSTSIDSILESLQAIPTADRNAELAALETKQCQCRWYGGGRGGYGGRRGGQRSGRGNGFMSGLGATSQEFKTARQGLPRFIKGIYWATGLFLKTPFTERCAGANKKASPPGRHLGTGV